MTDAVARQVQLDSPMTGIYRKLGQWHITAFKPVFQTSATFPVTFAL